MKIELAKHSGFCLGVRDSILRIVNEINTCNEDIYVYGPLIHNPQTIEVLNKRGLKTIDNLENIKNKQIAIRTHGIPADENKIIKSKASRMINLTCPRVAKVQSIIKKYSKEGYFTLIIGDEKHAEVIGLKSYATSGVKILISPDDLKNIPKKDKYLLVSQTTLDRDLFNKIVEKIKQKFPKTLIIDTICDSTKNRQADVKNGILQGIDTLVVVGGKNSANTKRLAQIGEEFKLKTLYIETENEISHENFIHSNNILVTAGASTPGWIINNVLEKLYDIKFKKANILINFIKIILEFTVRTNLLSSIAAYFFGSLIQKLIGVEHDSRLSFIAFMYIFSMYSINNYFDKEFLKTSNSYKYKIYERFGIHLLIASILAMVISITMSYGIGISIFVILILSYIFGFIYSTDLVKNIVKKLNVSFVRKLYNSKFITSFGWLFILILIPWVQYNFEYYDVIILSLYVLSFIFLRHFLIDMIAFQSDLIFGRESIPIIIGIKNLNILSIVIAFITVVSLFIYSIIKSNFIYTLFIINIIYYIILLNKIKKSNYLISLKYEFLVDFNFILLILFFYFL